MMPLEIKHTQRGFALGEFTDSYRQKCSLQKSSNIEDHIWLGVDVDLEGKRVNQRMHLTQEMVASLLPLLQRFVETGEIDALSRTPPAPAAPVDGERERLAKQMQYVADTLTGGGSVKLHPEDARAIAALLHLPRERGWRLVPAGTLLALYDMSRVDPKMHALFKKMMEIPLPSSPSKETTTDG